VRLVTRARSDTAGKRGKPSQLTRENLIAGHGTQRSSAVTDRGTVRAASPGRSEVKMQGLPRMGGMMGMGGAPQAATGDSPQVDTAENVQISSLALLKMLKHGRTGPRDDKENRGLP